MEDREFPMTRAVGFGWQTFTTNILLFIGLWAVIIIVELVVEGIPSYRFEDNFMVRLLMYPISMLVGCALEVGVITISLRLVAGEPTEFSHFFSKVNVVFYYLVATIIYSIIMMVGLVLFIIPGIYIAIRFQFYGYFIVDEGAGPIEALSRSGDITRGNMMNLFLFALLMFGLNLLGLLALVVGIFITVPLTWVATAYVYRYLNPGIATDAAVAVEPPEPQPL